MFVFKIYFMPPGMKDSESYSVWIIRLSVRSSVQLCEKRNGNMFEIESIRLTKLVTLVYAVMNHISMVTNSAGIGVGSRNRTMF